MPYHRITDAERLHTVIDAILMIEVDADLATLLATIVEQAAGLVGARYGALGVLSADGTSLAEFVTVGLTGDQRAAIGQFPVGHGILGTVIENPTPLRSERITEDPSTVGFPAHHPAMETFLGVPVRLEGGQVFGNLYLCDRADGQPFDDDDEAIVDALGRAAGLVIDRARLRLVAEEVALSMERQRLGRDLHDSVIQRLFAVGLSLQSLSSAGLPAEPGARIDRAIDDLDETIREIRSTIFAISRPEGPSASSLRREVLEICDEVSSRLGLDVTAALTGPIDQTVGRRVGDGVLAVLREALTNVVRHAEARSAEVTLEVSAEELTLTVADDGCGIDPTASRRGCGLPNLAARAQDLGGWFEAAPGPTRGTVLRWHITQLSHGASG